MPLSVRVVSAANVCDEDSAAALSAFAAVRVGEKGTSWEQKGSTGTTNRAETGKQGGSSSVDYNEKL